ncbi:MAG: LptF/LptG family permease [Planctomycetota bacterium]|nr:LptF/LptG family permease [Planctomycetota bacterium]MDP6940985.1 LptF/LptG family permease [Planctomycetota bacterium]
MRASFHRSLLSRSCFREIGAHLLLVLGGMTLLVALGAAVRATSTSQGAPLWVPLTLIPLLVGNALQYLIPATLLTAVVLTFGRMSSDGEITALQTAGMTPPRILRPAFLFGIAMFLLSYPLASSALPGVYKKIREITYQVRFAALENTNPGASEIHFRGLHLSWRGRAENGDFKNLLLTHESRSGPQAFAFDPGRKGQEVRTDPAGRMRLRASFAKMNLDGRDLVFQFKGLRSFAVDEGGSGAWSAVNEGPATVRIDLDSVQSGFRDNIKGDAFSSSEIREQLRGQLEPKRKRHLRYTLWKRLFTALSSIPLALLGALLGWRMRRGGIMAAFSVALGLLILVYFPLFHVGNSLQKTNALSPLFAACLPFVGMFVLLPLQIHRARSRA